MPNHLDIEVGTLELEDTNRPSPWDRLLGIQSNFRVLVDGREWLNQPMFPVVELAAAVSAWLQRGGDFEFETLEATESPFLWVRSVAGGCIVGAAWQAFPIDSRFPVHVVRGALKQFAAAVQANTKRELGIDVADLMAQAG